MSFFRLVAVLGLGGLLLSCGPRPEAEPAAAPVPSASSPLAVRTLSFADAGIQFDVPEGWQITQEHGVTMVASPDSSVFTTFTFPSQEEFQAAASSVADQVDRLLDQVQVHGKPENRNENGLESVRVSGSGRKEGEAVRWSLDLVRARKPVIALTFGAEGAFARYRQELDAVHHSVRALPAEKAKAPP